MDQTVTSLAHCRKVYREAWAGSHGGGARPVTARSLPPFPGIMQETAAKADTTKAIHGWRKGYKTIERIAGSRKERGRAVGTVFGTAFPFLSLRDSAPSLRTLAGEPTERLGPWLYFASG